MDKKEVMAHEKDGDLGYGWLKTGYAGSGPYTLRIWKASEIMILDASKNYWGDAPKLKRIIIRQIAGSSSQRMLLEKGDIDMARNLTADDLKSLEKNKDIKFQKRAKGRNLLPGVEPEKQISQNT